MCWDFKGNFGLYIADRKSLQKTGNSMSKQIGKISVEKQEFIKKIIHMQENIN